MNSNIGRALWVLAEVGHVVDARPMRTLLSGPLPWLIGAFALVSLAAFFWLAGSMVVIDETGDVEMAVAGNGSPEQALHRLWGGYFYAIPRVEGTIEVRCRNGVRKQVGYVTRHMHTTVKVIGTKPCERLVKV